MAAWTDNRTAIELFLACASAWRLLAIPGGLGQATRVIEIGLDWPAVAAIAAMIGTGIGPAELTSLRIMEAAALAAWTERRGRDGQ